MEVYVNPLIVSTSPHIHKDISIPRIMWSVNLALLPAATYGIYLFGIHVLWVLITGILTAVITEVVLQWMMKRPQTIADGSAFLTGLLLSMNLPPGVPLFIPAVGSFVAISIAKEAFGGLGWNIFNPALIGRAFLLASWPVFMTRWHNPHIPLIDTMTTATPLGMLKEGGMNVVVEKLGDNFQLYHTLFIGERAGCLGETSILLLLVGAIFLLWKGYITWHVPISYICTVFFLTWLFGEDPVFHIMAGGLILGAFFMATDMVTIPLTRLGQLIFGVGAGMLLVLIRLKGGYPEGCCYSILLMNCVTPLIDRYIKPKKYGMIK